MLDKLNDIDISAVKKLVKIKKEQDQLNSYLDKAESMKGKANDAVYNKVIDDYRTRNETLERTAVPLKVEARKEYQKLSTLLDEISEAHERAALDQEELEFRHTIGELSDKQLSEKTKETKSLVERRRSELAAADQLKNKFVEAFHSEQELDGIREAEESGEDLTRVGPTNSALATPPPVQTPNESVADEPTPPNKDETWIQPLGSVSPIDLGKTINPIVDTEPPPGEIVTGESERPQLDGSPPTEEDGVDSTFIVPEATLTTEENGRPMTQFHLGALSYIGRANDNQVQIKAAGVSRKHAVVTAGPEGFVIRDLDSQNGTYVNQNRVTECTLANGDRVRIGHVQLVFTLAS